MLQNRIKKLLAEVDLAKIATEEQPVDHAEMATDIATDIATDEQTEVDPDHADKEPS